MKKEFLTLMGEVVVTRSIYANDLIGGGYHVPLDAALTFIRRLCDTGNPLNDSFCSKCYDTG